MPGRFFLGIILSMIYDLIIIGGGPAGATAGIYAARKKLKTLMIAGDIGGQSVIAGEINNFIGHKSVSGLELRKMFDEHLRSYEGAEIKEGVKVLKIEKNNGGFSVFTDEGEGKHYEAKTVLMCAGSSHRELGAPGEEKFKGRGVFYCSTCDAPLMKGKIAAVIGGGNSGMYAAIDLLPYAEKIYILEYTDAFRCDPIYIDKIKASGKAEMITMAAVKEISGDEFVGGLNYEDRKSGEIKKIKLDGVFVAIGYKPNSALVKDLADINQSGKIIVDCETQKTTCEGLWAAGDVTSVLYNQINIAIGDSVKAVLNIYDSLNK